MLSIGCSMASGIFLLVCTCKQGCCIIFLCGVYLQKQTTIGSITIIGDFKTPGLKTMQKLTIELTDDNSLKALQDLEHKNIIRILREPEVNSYSLPGEPISEDDFRKWVEYAENSPTVSLIQAKQRWVQQKKKLQKLIR